MANTKTPQLVPPSALLVGVAPGLNDAVLADVQRQETQPKEMPYNRVTDNGLASTRSKHVVRTHAEVAAATQGDLPLGDGLSLRMALPGQCENELFPFQTDAYGKQRR